MINNTVFPGPGPDTAQFYLLLMLLQYQLSSSAVTSPCQAISEKNNYIQRGGARLGQAGLKLKANNGFDNFFLRHRVATQAQCNLEQSRMRGQNL